MKKEKYIKIYDVIFNAEYSLKTYKEKWDDFDKAVNDTDNFDDYDFFDKSEQFRSKKGLMKDITGIGKITNEFPSFNLTGEKAYLKYKSEQIECVIEEYKKITFDNTKSIFSSFELEAIKKVLDYCKDTGIINYNGKVFMYASNEIYAIAYNNIVVPLVKNNDSSNVNYNSIVNYGTMNGVNQAFNLNITNDDDLFGLVVDKIEAIRIELKDKQNDKIEELEKALKKKDKKSVLTIISELASLGSLIATIIQMYGVK